MVVCSVMDATRKQKHTESKQENMLKDNLFIGREARGGIISGIRKITAAVGATMGTGGSNALVECIESPGFYSTNDGFSILNAIQFADPLEEIGRKILSEAVNRSNKQSGDGSSTTCVLTAAIIEEGMKQGDAIPAMDLKRSLEECIPLIEASINAQKRDVTLETVGAVASISAEDPEIGARIQEIYQQIGIDGIIHWDVSKTAQDSYSIGKGITIEDCGWASPYMCDATQDGRNTMQIRLKNPRILLTKQKIVSASQFNVIAGALNAEEIKDLVVFCDEYDPLVMTDIVKTRQVRGFRIILVKMPTFWKEEWYEDLAAATEAQIIDPIGGLKLESVTKAMLGTCENIEIWKDQTAIDGIKDLTEHIAGIGTDTDEAKIRVARLNQKTARYFVGAHSEVALSYRRLKVEDAISAAWQALHGGVCAGGGVALRNAAWSMPGTIGGHILQQALMSPMEQIMKNAGDVSHEQFDFPSSNQGYNTRTKTFVDMFEAQITDPAPIVMNAVRNAISVAASVLTANTLVLLPRQEYQMTPNGPVPISV